MRTLGMDLLHRQVVSAVGKLPDAQRAVMLLVAVEGLSYHAAAEALGVAVDTVMSRAACARLTIGEKFGAKQRGPNGWQAHRMRDRCGYNPRPRSVRAMKCCLASLSEFRMERWRI